MRTRIMRTISMDDREHNTFQAQHFSPSLLDFSDCVFLTHGHTPPRCQHAEPCNLRSSIVQSWWSRYRCISHYRSHRWHCHIHKCHTSHLQMKVPLEPIIMQKMIYERTGLVQVQVVWRWPLLLPRHVSHLRHASPLGASLCQFGYGGLLLFSPSVT